MPKTKKQNTKRMLLAGLEEIRDKRVAIMSRIPLIKEMEEEKIRDGVLSITRVVTRILDHYPTREVFGMVYGLVGPYIYPLLSGTKPTDSFIENTRDYLKITTLWGLLPMEILDSSESHIEVKYDYCPLSIRDEKKLCDAYMAMEPGFSERDAFRTRISVLECIPDGQGRCRILFEKK